MKPLMFVLTAMLFLGTVGSPRAEEVKLSHGGLTLNANLEADSPRIENEEISALAWQASSII